MEFIQTYIIILIKNKYNKIFQYIFFRNENNQVLLIRCESNSIICLIYIYSSFFKIKTYSKYKLKKTCI